VADFNLIGFNPLSVGPIAGHLVICVGIISRDSMNTSAYANVRAPRSPMLTNHDGSLSCRSMDISLTIQVLANVATAVLAPRFSGTRTRSLNLVDPRYGERC
jgi:hypothetical protein